MIDVMKTTIEIADDLVTRAKLVQQRDSTTLRALVEDGLRIVLDRRSGKSKYKFVPVVAGEPWKPGMPVLDVNGLVAEANDRAWAKREFGSGAVHEPSTSYRKRSAAKKRKR